MSHHLSIGRMVTACAAAFLLGCNRLPEANSSAAQLYAARCTENCHRIYQPRTMKFHMWRMMVERMQGEMARRGVRPLDEEEKIIILNYLRRHAG